MSRPIGTLLGLVAAASVLFGCTDDGVAPTPASVAGDYTATSITITDVLPGREEDVTRDLLSGGLTISITLTADGMTTGEMFIPAALTNEGTDKLHDLMGTFSVRGSTVRFAQGAATFLRDMPFTVVGSQLRATQIEGYSTFSVRLTRQ